jgi:hypothetical protein
MYALLGGIPMVSTFFAAVDSLRGLPVSNHKHLFRFQGKPSVYRKAFQMVFFNYYLR